MRALRALVLTAIEQETVRWRERYDFTETRTLRGVDGGVHLTADGVGLACTGMGPANAAATVAALQSAAELDVGRAYVCTAGIAGAPPERAVLGDVFLNDCLVDWDEKLRWDADATDRDADGAAPDHPIRLLPYSEADPVWRLDEGLVDAARAGADGVDLASTADARRQSRLYAAADGRDPRVERGTSVAGGEYWHGEDCARLAEWLVDRYGGGTYVTTECEGAATARTLDRFDRLDRYLSVRGVSNFDRPAPGETVAESFGRPDPIALAAENAFRVASAVVDRVVEEWDEWRSGPPGAD